ncbi:class I SAM-dependent methyltransferase [Chryseobacterium sp. G0186]|uniref:class I SAM-dependent methyltransferase n=1 Tax=Chryseobacterium sp. G0186 TaxID=2487064 RepID=UPI000F505B68|nr:class I SAM-dependent methyltransferase [Chryseobacterium sp. G0186]AZA76051.1 class I SAM-dependent methyltransferase [Chryseobacterium sp. G0186]
MKLKVPGTEGYADALDKFIEATVLIDFTVLHHDFIPFIPKTSSRILDLGAGIGKDSSVFSAMGHSVTAVEPSEALIEAGKKLYPDFGINWIQDALPELGFLSPDVKFDFILISGVWHHLSPEEQHFSMIKGSQLLTKKGILALSLRNGPAGVGTHIFPTRTIQTIQQAEQTGLKTLLTLEKQPSLLPGKETVTWSRLIFQKIQ